MQPDRTPHASTIRVLVADNSPFHTRLLVEALSRESDLRVFSSELATASIVAASDNHKADILVLSGFMDQDSERGINILRELRETGRHTRAIVLLDSSKLDSVLQAFRAGVRGVFDPRESPERLCQCIRQVHLGQVWINNEQMALVLESLASAPTLKTVDARGMSLLSKREAEVVRCVTEGLSNREIADRLGLSQHTIKNHMFRIFDKLGVSNRIELLFVTLSQNTTPRDGEARMQDLLAPAYGEVDPESMAACEKAAESGVLSAQLVLARNCWLRGSDEYDAVRAYLWFSMALDQLTHSKNNVQKAMSPGELAEAERQVRERINRSRVEPSGTGKTAIFGAA